MAANLSIPSPLVRHDNHTAPGTFTERTFVKPADFLLVRNTDTTNSALVSFDGLTGFTLKPDEILTLSLKNKRTYWTKAAAGTPALEVLVGSDE